MRTMKTRTTHNTTQRMTIGESEEEDSDMLDEMDMRRHGAS